MKKGSVPADEEADGDLRVQDVETRDLEPHGRGVGAEEGQRGEGGRADGEALADGGRGVADGVEAVGDGAHLGSEAAHLADATRVVGDGPYASTDMVTPTVASMPTAAMPIP
jgi:hypothetical protein